MIEYSTNKYKTNEGFRQNVRKNLRLKDQDKDFQQRKKEYGKERYHKKPEHKAKVTQSKKRRKEILMHQNVLIQIMYWRISRRKLQRGRVMHVLHVIDFYLKIKWRNVIWNLLKKNQSQYGMLQDNAYLTNIYTLVQHIVL